MFAGNGTGAGSWWSTSFRCSALRRESVWRGRLKAILGQEERRRESEAALRREAESRRGYFMRARRLTSRELGF